MVDITQKLKKIIESRKNQKVIYKQSNERPDCLFVNDLSVK